jgi:Mrp family chromosome partitioning ATPase
LERQFDDLPEREKSMVILERDFLLNQKIYKFLAEKKMESSIVQAATISFHRIIEKGTVPKDPVSPNKKFLSIVAGFLMVMMSILFIYIRTNFASRTQTRNDVEKQSAIPVIGIVPKLRSQKNGALKPLGIIATELMTKKIISKHQILTVISGSKKEGKTYISEHLSRAFSALDWNVLLIDYNFYNRSLTAQFDALGSTGLLTDFRNPEGLNSAIQQISDNLSFLPSGSFSEDDEQLINPQDLTLAIDRLKDQYDLIIIDTPATTITNDAIMLIKHADCVLHILRCGKTHTHMIHQADLMAQDYKLSNMNLLINATPKAFNFNGSLTGSRYHYHQNSGLWATLKRYFDIYIR